MNFRVHFSENIRDNLYVKILVLIFVLIPVLLYYFIINKFAINIPIADDYEYALSWLIEYRNSSSKDLIGLLFRQANEHRIFSFFFSVFFDYEIFGEVNFRHLTIVGNLSLLFLVYVLYDLVKSESVGLLAFTPVILLLFVPQQSVSNWSILTFNGLVEYLLIVSSLYLLNNDGKLNLVFATLLAFLATFSFGNGMLVFLCGYLILFLNNKKTWFDKTFWTIAMVLSLIYYFTDYRFTAKSGSILEYLQNPFDIFQFFFVFFGNVFSPFFQKNLLILAVVGFLILSSFAYLLFFKWTLLKKYPVSLAILIFIILSAAMVVVSRISFGVAGATANRYMVLQYLFVAIMYILYLQVFKGIGKYVLLIVLAGSVTLYSMRMEQNLQLMENFHHRLKMGLLTFYKKQGSEKLMYPNQKRAAWLIGEGIKGGYYNPPVKAELLSDYKNLKRDLKKVVDNNVKYNIDAISDTLDLIKIRGWAFLKQQNTNNQKIGIALISESDTLYYSTRAVLRKRVATAFRKHRKMIPKKCGFDFLLEKQSPDIMPGRYRINIFVERNKKIVAISNTDHYIDILPWEE